LRLLAGERRYHFLSRSEARAPRTASERVVRKSAMDAARQATARRKRKGGHAPGDSSSGAGVSPLLPGGGRAHSGKLRMLYEFITAHREEIIARTRAKVAKRLAPKPTKDPRAHLRS